MRQLNLHTPGGEFWVGGTTIDYVGHYNVDDNGGYFSGRSYTDESVPLAMKPVMVLKYDKMKSTSLPDAVTAYTPTPTGEDYKRGWFFRYFARQTNDISSKYIEIDKTTYTSISNGENPFYTTVSLRWKISGPEIDVMDGSRVVEAGVANTNSRTLNQLSQKHPYLSHRLQNLREYWKEGRAPVFGPALSQGFDGTLTLNKPTT